MKQGLKIETRTRQVLYDSSLIAGVDYQDDDVHAAEDDQSQADNNAMNRDNEEALDVQAADNSEEDRDEVDINEDLDDESQASEESNPTEVEIEQDDGDDQAVEEDDEQEDASDEE